jgi:hypothetical protein
VTIVLHPPVAAPLTQLWGEHPEWYYRFGYTTGHNGEDYGCAVGTPILPAAPGRVIKIAFDPSGFGHYLKLQHDGCQTLYAHLSRVDVRVGQEVGPSDILGLSGNTGNSTGPHLHFGLYLGGQAVNPRPYMAAVEATPQPDPEPCADTEHTPPTVGERGQVVVDLLYLRTGPSREAQTVGSLHHPALIEIAETATEGPRTWGRITRSLWCCLREGCVVYVAAQPQVGCGFGSVWTA